CSEYYLDDQTTANITQFLKDTLAEYGVHVDVVYYVVSDNENTMKAAFHSNRVGCAGHYLNIIIKHSFTTDNEECASVQAIFVDIRSIVAHVRRSHAQCKLSSSLKTYSESRWNSVYFMLKSVENVHDELLKLLVTKPELRLKLAATNNILLHQVNDLLKFFCDMSEKLSQETFQHCIS
ncbi:unnamed protein product, partial [Didymodactylos carnosus]